MNKKLIIAIALLLLAGIIYFFFANTTEVVAPEDSENEAIETPEAPAMETMPVPEEADAVETMTAEEMEQSMEGDKGGAPEMKMFDVGGSNFSFDVEEIRVKEGDTVMIHFTSTGGFHDWVVDEFDAATDQVNTGESTSVTFVASKAGTYEYYCSVGNHRAQGMMGTLVVE